MDKSKLILIILAVLVLATGVVAMTISNSKKQLNDYVNILKGEKEELTGKYNSLQNVVSNARKERASAGRRLSAMREELSLLEEERDSWQDKWAITSREKEMLVGKLQSLKDSASERVSVRRVQPIVIKSGTSEEHWVDFVNEKATLEVKLEEFNEQLIESKNEAAKLYNDNKELSIMIDELSKVKDRLQDELRFKVRTLRIMGMDLVGEREERVVAVEEVRKLRRENVSLKRELVLANKQKIGLQTQLKDRISRMGMLSNKIADAETLIREKSLAFGELQEQLQRIIITEEPRAKIETASVELPSIIVKPDSFGLRGLRGQVIAVNNEDRFIVIDIGESSGVKPGLLLKVMRGGKEIATIEVIETRKEICAADIKELRDGLIIQEGDVAIR